MEANIEQRWVDCENGKISYFLIRKSVKNVNLTVKSDGRVLGFCFNDDAGLERT